MLRRIPVFPGLKISSVPCTRNYTCLWVVIFIFVGISIFKTLFFSIDISNLSYLSHNSITGSPYLFVESSSLYSGFSDFEVFPFIFSTLNESIQFSLSLDWLDLTFTHVRLSLMIVIDSRATVYSFTEIQLWFIYFQYLPEINPQMRIVIDRRLLIWRNVNWWINSILEFWTQHVRQSVVGESVLPDAR